jgi:hypothetical protein
MIGGPVRRVHDVPNLKMNCWSRWSTILSEGREASMIQVYPATLQKRVTTMIGRLLYSCVLLAVLGLTSGCASSSSHHGHGRAESAHMTDARPPEWLTGPIGVLLTNRDAYSAHVVVDDRGSETADQNAAAEFRVWRATDLQNVPLEIQSRPQTDTTTFDYPRSGWRFLPLPSLLRRKGSRSMQPRS